MKESYEPTLVPGFLILSNKYTIKATGIYVKNTEIWNETGIYVKLLFKIIIEYLLDRKIDERNWFN